MNHVVYDSGALIAAAKNDRRFVGRHKRLLTHGVGILVPAGVLAQTWDPRPRAAVLHWLLQGCRILSLTEAAAKRAAALCHSNGSSDVVDATVVIASVQYGDAPIVTDDLGDISALAKAAGRDHITIRRP
ncbi:twitching motility protein PilT [Streptomyces chitinivorans]|uniref:Twitching motility protein PilT n=1 Tax=Streptomyces chitinivorans TaxID=1257027 RepID=A0ABW7HMS2_9ACTN|nr:twitching motility protein PilT [Streptomyces chitinivorans]MDH2408381.1 twitching motility protein PilT [Streptomyces chitinivorans]